MNNFDAPRGPTIVRPVDVLLCGSRYGASYLPAIYQARELQLAGLFARGSEQSVRLAEQAGVPLYTRLEQLDQVPVALACVALPQAIAVPVAQTLLRQGIAVLIEHPLSATNINTLLSTATQAGSRCHVNTHFAQLPPVLEFIGLCRSLNQHSQALTVQASCNSRTLYSLLDILLSSFGQQALSSVQICRPNSQARNYTYAHFNLGELPINLTYQNWRGIEDDSQDAPLGHQLVVTYPEGTLSLGGSFGPTYWAPVISTGADGSLPAYSHATDASRRAPSVAEVVHWRTQANRQAMLDLLQAAGPAHKEQKLKQQLSQYRQSATQLHYLSELWTRLDRQLGPHVATACAPAVTPVLSRAQSLLAEEDLS